MDTTCATVITDGKHLLICHPTGASMSKMWSFPKGIMDSGETEKEAAIRELREETSLSFDQSQFQFLGFFPYSRKKNIFVFGIKVEKMPDVSALKCEATFDLDKFEIDAFKVIKIDKYKDYLNKRLVETFDNIIKQVKEL